MTGEHDFKVLDDLKKSAMRSKWGIFLCNLYDKLLEQHPNIPFSDYPTATYMDEEEKHMLDDVKLRFGVMKENDNE